MSNKKLRKQLITIGLSGVRDLFLDGIISRREWIRAKEIWLELICN